MNGEGDGYNNPTYVSDVHIQGKYTLSSVQNQLHNTFYKNTVIEPGQSRQSSQRPQGNGTYSTLRDSQATPCNDNNTHLSLATNHCTILIQIYAVIAGAQEEDEFGVDYHNFDNPLYTDSQTVLGSPTYSRTELPGPRGSAVGNGRSSVHIADVSSTSAVPGPMEYDYVGVNHQQADGGGAATSANRLRQDDGIYELLNKDE